MATSDYGVVTRLTRLLALLGDEPVDRDTLIDKLPGEYGTDIETVQRAFRRDIQALNQLGFDLRRYGGRPPQYTLHGHTRWPAVSGKTCPSCKRMLSLAMFAVVVSRPSHRSVYCYDCAREKRKQSYLKYRERNLEYARRRREVDPDIYIRKRDDRKRRRNEGRAIVEGEQDAASEH